MSTSYHICINLRGALMNWADYMWRECVTDEDGRILTPSQVKMRFLNEIAKGRKVIPMDPTCDNFDYQKGCQGHPVAEEAKARESAK